MIFLDDLLLAPDFENAMNNLAPEFRERFALPEIHQLGLAVSDVEKAALQLEEKGLPPFFIASGSPAYWIEKGEPRSFSGRLGFSRHHGVELELLEPGHGSDFYRRSLDPDNRIVVQHLGFLVDDVDGWMNTLKAGDIGVWVRGAIELGPAKIQFAYMDTEKDIGVIIEFISQRFLGLPWWPMDAIFRTVARIQKRTGKRSLSV